MKIIVHQIEYDYDEKLSLKGFMNKYFTDASELNGKVIYNSCFSNETLDARVFPDDMKNVTFINCNLDNCFIPNPESNRLIFDNGFEPRRFQVQNDGEDWIVDEDNNPIEPLNKKMFLRVGMSIDPQDIPDEKLPMSPLTDKLLQL